MKVIINDEFIEKVYESYCQLGIRIDASNLESLNDKYNSMKVGYQGENERFIITTIGKLDIEDINSAYIHSNEIADSKKEIKDNNEAYKVLMYNVAGRDTKNAVNKLLFNYLKKMYSVVDLEENIINTTEEAINNSEKKDDVADKNNQTGDVNFVLVDYDQSIHARPVKDNSLVKVNTTYANNETNNNDVDRVVNINTTHTNNDVKNSDVDRVVKIDSVTNKAELDNYTKHDIANKKAYKVVRVEEDEETANKGRKFTAKDTVLVLAGIIILSSAILFAVYNYSKNKVEEKELKNKTNTETIDNTYNDNNEVEETNNNNETIENTNENNNETTESEEVVEEQVDVHSEDYINNVTEKTFSSIQALNDPAISSKYDRELVEALVRYTHHNYNDYTGENKLSNEIAYEDLSELINHGFDISMFYEGLNNSDNLYALYNATRNIKQEKASYEDEFKVYMCMDVIMDEMNTNNFAEAVALRAYVDNYSSVPSMQMARNQAGVLEMKDTQDLWRDVNKDGKTTYEENAEGKGYNDEKASALAAKYNEMSSEKCANIYKRISTDDQNSELSVIVYKAIDEDETIVRSR